MSSSLKRAINRQKAIRESRDFAWIMLVVVLAVGYVGVIGVIRAIEVGDPTLIAAGVFSGIVAAIAIRVALHLVLEALRLGRLMKDLNKIMHLDDSSGLASGVRWSGLNPFSRRRS